MTVVGTAPWETESSAVCTIGASGGTAAAIASTSRCWTAGSVMNRPIAPATSSAPGMRAMSALYASPFAVRPPPAPS